METAASPSHAEPAAPSGAGPETAPEPETIASAGFWPLESSLPAASASESPLWSSSSPSPAPTAPPASSPTKGPRLRPGRRAAQVGAPWHAEAGGRSGNGAWLRRAAVAAAVVAVVAVLAVAGWQTHWPAAVFGAKARPVAQVGAAPGGSSVPAASPAAVPGSAPASPTLPATPATPTSPPASSPPVAPLTPGPAATVRAYFAAITAHDYAKAWQLGGHNLGISYPEFVSGFRGTAKDAVPAVSVVGDVVTARLVAEQTNGSVKTFQGTYTVQNGEIIQFDVRQVS